jgi:hypothetical protein
MNRIPLALLGMMLGVALSFSTVAGQGRPGSGPPDGVPPVTLPIDRIPPENPRFRVPEASTLVLLGSGLGAVGAALAMWRRRRSTRS